MFALKKYKNLWDGKIEPFKIIGNVYFVGCYAASTHLIDTGDGLVLIDPGYMQTLHLVINSIYSLGFSPYDIKYIVNTHWHGDHTAGTAALASLCGAKTLIGKNDAEKAMQFFTPDILIDDLDTLKLGNLEMQFYETPGHTRGTVSFFFDTEDNGKHYRVGMFGGAGRNTLSKGHFDYPDCRDDFRHSVARLHNEHVDVFIGNHVWNNNTDEFGKILRETGENRFIDETLWTKFLNRCIESLESIIKREEDKEKTNNEVQK